MAEGSQFPKTVTVKDGYKDKKEHADFCTIYLEIPDLKVSKPFGPLGEPKPENAEITKQFTKRKLYVKAKVTNKGDVNMYEYDKSVPEDLDLDPDNTKFKVREETVAVIVKKAKSQSWTSRSNHFMEED